MTVDAMEQAEALEQRQIEALGERFVHRSWLYRLGDGDMSAPPRPTLGRVLMGEDPRLPAMPEKPTLMDFFRLRFSPGQQHLLQSARMAMNNGLPEKMVLACLLHDIGTVAFIRADHGYWGAQIIEPYVDEEVSWAVREHQAMKFFADESMGYAYPESYRTMFGEDYVPAPYIQAAYDKARKHRWYMSGRTICMNDDYSFNPDLDVSIDEFEDVIGRNFRQPLEGLGNDASPSAHMWRTIRRPANAL
jgi:hypothetical protein